MSGSGGRSGKTLSPVRCVSRREQGDRSVFATRPFDLAQRRRTSFHVAGVGGKCVAVVLEVRGKCLESERRGAITPLDAAVVGTAGQALDVYRARPDAEKPKIAGDNRIKSDSGR
jgi:hypothetical protein